MGPNKKILNKKCSRDLSSYKNTINRIFNKEKKNSIKKKYKKRNKIKLLILIWYIKLSNQFFYYKG